MQDTYHMDQKTRPSYVKPSLVVFSAALFFLFIFINMNSFDALNDGLRKTFHIGSLQISNLSAMYFYANVLFLIPAGLLLDRFSTKKILLCAMAIAIASTYVFAFTKAFWVVETCRFITGMTSTTCLISTALLTSRWFPAHKNALIMGLVITLAMVGGFMAQYINFLSEFFGGWQWAIFSVASLGIVFLIIVAFFVQDFPNDAMRQKQSEQTKLQEDGFWKSFSLALKNRQNWLCGVYTNLMSIPILVLGALWAEDYLQTVHHLSVSHASLVAAMIFWGLIFGCPISGAISDNLKNRKIPMVLGAILTLAMSLIIIYVHSLSFINLLGLFFLLGFFSGTQVIVYAIVIESSPPRLVASSQGLCATIIMASGAIFQPLYGFLLHYHAIKSAGKYTTIYNAQDFHFAMILLPIAFGVSVLIALLIKETNCRPFAG